MRTSNARKHLSWVDYYIKAAEELQGPIAVFENGYSVYDSLVESYINDSTKFIDKIERNPNFSFLLLPTATRGVLNVTHCNTLFEDASETIIIGVNGTRFTSPWKVISSDNVVKPLRTPSRRSPILSIPSLESIINCSSSEEFNNLTGEEEGAELQQPHEGPMYFGLVEGVE